MAQVTLDQALVGMVLASNVHDRRGRLLMPAGKELTERHLAAMRMWGVSLIEVEGEGPEVESEPDFDEEILARADAEIDDLFSNAGEDHPLLAELRKLARVRVAREIARAPVEVA